MLTNTSTDGRSRSVSSVSELIVPRTGERSKSGAGVLRARPGAGLARDRDLEIGPKPAPVRPQLQDSDREDRGEDRDSHQRDRRAVQARHRRGDARPGTRDDDHPRHRCQNAVPNQGRRAGGFRVDLAEAVTIGGLSSRHRAGDGAGEREQEEQRAERSPPRGGANQERDPDRELGQREHDPADPGGPRRHAEFLERAPRAW